MGEAFEFKSLGFIGLGAMGKPMLVHLANKLPVESRIYVFDVVEKVVDELCAEFPNKVFKASSAKDVAQQAVSMVKIKEEGTNVNSSTGDSHYHGPRRVACPLSLPRPRKRRMQHRYFQ
jgi:3-hydroxyisobutyrate dehydrogenase-like beta-hydroxyacid dehydrogenase